MAAVTRKFVEEQGLVGALFAPDDAEGLPSVVLLGGSDGGLQEGTAGVLAREGFAVLALGYFGVGSLPRELVEVPLEYFSRAFAWLRQRPESDGDQVAVAGTSKSGELALLLGATYTEDVRSVVAYAPSPVVWQGVAWDPQAFFGLPKSSWTMGGRPVPFVRLGLPQPSDYVEVRSFKLPVWPFVAYTPSFRYPVSAEAYARALDRESDPEAKAIKVENIEGPVLLVSGTEDLLWNSTRHAEMVMERLESHGHPHPREHLVYEGAGHMTGLPFSTSIKAREGPFVHGGSLGGTTEANGHMSADSWEKVVRFLSGQ